MIAFHARKLSRSDISTLDQGLETWSMGSLPTPSVQGDTHRVSTQLGCMDEDTLDKTEGPLSLARLRWPPIVR